LTLLGQDSSIQGLMLGQKLRELREKHQFVQREVAAKLEIDTAYISKMENGTKQISRSWLPTLAEMFEVEEEALVILWLADKVEKIVGPEKQGHKVVELVYHKLSNTK